MATATDLIASAVHARSDGRPEDAKLAFERAIEVSRASDDRSSLARALAGHGQIERDLGNSKLAERNYLEAVEILRALGDPFGLAHAVRHVADILTERGELDAAVPYYEEALLVYRARGDAARPLDVANAVMGFARVRQALGDDDEARVFIHEAREIYSRLDIAAGADECDARLTQLRDS